LSQPDYISLSLSQVKDHGMLK